MTLVLLSTLAVVATAAPAAADISTASAEAASLTVLGQPVISTGTTTADNPEGEIGEQTTGPQPPALVVLGEQDILNASVLAQDAEAGDNGDSQACAGAVGEGGLLQVGQPGECDAGDPDPGGVVINLTPLLRVKADAIYAECTAQSGAAPTSRVTIVGLRVETGLEGADSEEIVDIPVNAEPNTEIFNIPGVLSIVMNEQPVPGEQGRVDVTALRVQLLGAAGGGVDLRIGHVTCGRNLLTAEIPAFVAEGLPFALAVVGVLGLGAYAVLRRRNNAGVAA